MFKVFGARVKNVLSGDTLVLSPLNGASNQERVLSLAHLQAPRLPANEKYAYESRESLRKLLIGKEIRFWVIYKSQSDHEFGDVSSPIFSSLIEYVLEKGGAKLRDNLDTNDNPELENLKEIESKARSANIGIWDSDYKPIEIISRPSEDDIERSVSQPAAAIVEKVISGDRLFLRLLLDDQRQAVLPVLVAGVKSPRTANGDQPAEPCGEAAKGYVEARLLGRDIKVSLLGESASGVLVGKIIHPAGNISDKLLTEGFAEVADWQSSFIGAKGMSVLRKAEKSARSAGKGVWKADSAASNGESAESVSVGEIRIAAGSTFHASVSRIISADTLELRLKNDAVISVQLAYLRGPRQSDAITAPFVNAAREFVREKAIGKQVLVTVEFVRPATEQYEERPMVTILIHGSKNLSELVVSNGYATVLHHRKGDDVADYWDLLVECEEQAKKTRKGIFGKAPDAGRIVDASENASKAQPYLFTFKNRSKIPGIVEHVMSASRYRIFLPREGIRLILVLGGLVNNKGGRDDKTNKQAFALANKKAYQREISIDIYGTDRIGSFIGDLFLPGSNQPFQVALLENGLAKCHERSLGQTKYGSAFSEAETTAKNARVGLWNDYDPSQDVEVSEEALSRQVKEMKIERNYYDVDVSEVLPDGHIAIQILDADRSKLKPFMQRFHAASSRFQPYVSAPRRNEIVAAKFSQNGKYYRAKILGHDKTPGKFEIQQVDYGTIESVPLSDLLQLPTEYQVSTYKSQSHIVQLSLVNLPPESQPDYLQEAIYFLENKLLDKQMVACETYKNPTPGVEMDVELYDPAVISTNPNFSINKEMVQEGWGLVKKKDLALFEKLLKEERATLLKVEADAKRLHKGCWKYGDIEGEDLY
ncbi:hypothetical protein FOA43_001428 [Brettanomyces nanus]|uniref:Uncharacterized protein n=1 Tax=Eeniella nana TaxID=13502 RepID=A0A875RY93_EENNA|nr:uncharacterized protein FOA43_001428 [Brettanomyces nanus]QPG74106.1 hypothetical protein FOA43_001428 [Brettanomyces nanus]